MADAQRTQGGPAAGQEAPGRARVTLYDTTLRDGQQTHGVQFSLEDKRRLAEAIDALGIDYIEGGWPGANPTDSDFFADPPATRARMTAFGMTRRAGRSAANDETLALVLDAGTPAVCLVGKSHPWHVTGALGIPLEENIRGIAESIGHVVAREREALFDAEHFFDGWKADRAFALDCLHAALEAGARWIVLCDTNGGTLPGEIGEITAAVIAAGIPGERLGIHCHNDTGTAVAGSLAALEAGVRQIQGTIGGLGERCGNADILAIAANLALKPALADRYVTGMDAAALRQLTPTARLLDEILNRPPLRNAPYVGAAAFAHKAGLHASAILKDPASYEHVPPERVGNRRIVPMSNQAGQSNLRHRLAEAGIPVEKGDPRLGRLLGIIKEREDAGYAYDSAAASFEILARRELGLLPRFFEVKRYRVTVERRRNRHDRMATLSEAVVSVKIGEERKLSVSESRGPNGEDLGPVNALWRALVKDLGPYQDAISDMHLTDYRVRITGTGTDAVTRVVIDFAGADGLTWSTVGVSSNIVDASFEAIHDAIVWKLVHDEVAPVG